MYLDVKCRRFLPSTTQLDKYAKKSNQAFILQNSQVYKLCSIGNTLEDTLVSFMFSLFKTSLEVIKYQAGYHVRRPMLLY